MNWADMRVRNSAPGGLISMLAAIVRGSIAEPGVATAVPSCLPSTRAGGSVPPRAIGLERIASRLGSWAQGRRGRTRPGLREIEALSDEEAAAPLRKPG
jgi:hypothetical protein